jgi:GDP-L-fucose synthase
MACNLYGYGDHFEPTNSHVVSALIYKFERARRLGLPQVEVWGTGTPRRELLFVSDMVDAMLYFMTYVDAGDVGPFINVGSGQEIAIRDLATTIKDIVGYKGGIAFDAGKPDGMPRKLMDVSKAARLGWRAKINICEGLQRTYDWYLANIQREVIV